MTSPLLCQAGFDPASIPPSITATPPPMKTLPSHSLRSALAALTAGLLLAAGAHAGIIGINAGASSASVNFDDTNSYDVLNNQGTTNLTLPSGPWTGAIFGMTPTSDPVTGDNAEGYIAAAFAGTSYAVNFSSVTLNQGFLGSTGNTGYAQMHIQFTVEFQLDGAGLPSQATLFPGFTVSGTVQSQINSFAFLGGVLNYYDSLNNLVESVSYSQTFNVPGPFPPTTVPGTPTFGITPTLAPNSTLTLDGNFSFVVDPAIMFADSQMVPEPSSALLALLSLPLLLRRRRG